MGKRDLNKKYRRLQNWHKKYRDELIAYIKEAFDIHRNEFVLKPKGCQTWEERSKADDFEAMEELPYYLLIGVEDGNLHEIHISRICRHPIGFLRIDFDGWDWNENEFVERWEVFYDLESLSTIAEFINAVFEQEKNDWIKVGVKCKWNDPAIGDYKRSERKEILNRVWTIEQIKGEVILLSHDGGEAEVLANEIVPV